MLPCIRAGHDECYLVYEQVVMLDSKMTVSACLACLPEPLFSNSVDPSIREGLVC